MKKTYFITGTDTDIGKSVITAGLSLYFQDKGIKTAAFKPLQSGAKKYKGRYYSEDAYLAASLLGCPEKSDQFGPFCFPGEVAPYYAMQDNDTMVTLPMLTEKYKEMQGEYDLLFVDGAGGVCVPYLSEDFLAADLALAWDMMAIIVARGTLGTINHLLMTIEYLRGKDIAIAGFILNKVEAQYRQEAELNAQAVERMSGVQCLGIMPELDGLKPDIACSPDLLKAMQENCILDSLYSGKMK